MLPMLSQTQSKSIHYQYAEPALDAWLHAAPPTARLNDVDFLDLVTQLTNASNAAQIKPKLKETEIINIHLLDGQYLSDLDIPQLTDGKPKLVQVNAGVSTGKTTCMVKGKGAENDVMITHQISIKDQTLSDYGHHENRADVMQLEHSASANIPELSKYRLVNFDEATTITDAGTYRIETISKVYDKIQQLRKHTTVALWSGTFRPEFNPFRFDVIINVHRVKPISNIKVYHAVGEYVNVALPKQHPDDPTETVKQEKMRPVTTDMMVDVVLKERELSKGYKPHAPFKLFDNSVLDEDGRMKHKPILLLHDSTKDLLVIQAKLLEYGVTSTVCNSQLNKNNKHNEKYKKLMDTSMIGSMGVDVVLTTCCLREGINILDPMHVIVMQAASEFMQQSIARARDTANASYLIIMGNGKQCMDLDAIKLYRSDGLMDIESMTPQGTDPRCKFTLDTYRENVGISITGKHTIDHITSDTLKRSVITHAIYNYESKQSRYAFDTVNKFCGLYGFNPEFIVIGDDIGSETFVLPDYLKAIPKKDIRYALDNNFAEYQMADHFGYNIEDCQNVYDKLESFKDVYESCAVSIDGVSTWEKAYSAFAAGSLLFVASMCKRQLTFIKKIINNNLETFGEIPAESMQETADNFWRMVVSEHHLWLYPEYDGQRVRVFIWLMGLLKYKRRNDKIVSIVYRLPARKALADLHWWKSKGLTACQRGALGKRKKVIESSHITLMDFCNKHQVSQLDVVNMKMKQVKLLLVS